MSQQRGILVTGGAGYIGSHTCKALAEAGYCPVTFDNLLQGHLWAVKWGPLFTADIAKKELLLHVLHEYRIEAVVHFAAYTYVGESMSAPGKYFQNNVANTLTLLDAMLEAGVKSMVFSSTCATYGVAESIPICEDNAQNPVNPYGESKLFVERAIRWYEAAHGLRSVALRYFNAAGADPDGEIGEDHNPETHLIPLVMQAAMGRRPHIDIYGTDYPTRDGTAIRDYVHVADLAAAHIQALEYLLEGGKTIALNLGTGAGHTVREVISAVEQVSGLTVPAREAPRRAGDPPILVADPRLTTGTFHWKPRYSSLKTIAETAWEWHSRDRGMMKNLVVPLYA